MPLRLVEVFADPGYMDTVAAIAHRFHALQIARVHASEEEAVAACRILTRPEQQQELIDQLQGALGKDKPWRITILPVEATIPQPEPDEGEKNSPEQATREELYADIERDVRIDSSFLLLVVLSTIVATIGLLENNSTVIIAAMLIAPLLGPNVAMAFGSALGDLELVASAAIANLAGISLSVACAALAALAYPPEIASAEMAARTTLGYDSLMLALASGAAGALSLTTKLPGALVGVMVAVALLPPAAALGYMLRVGDFRSASGSAVLLAANIVGVNLAAQLVFFSKGVKPRTWLQRRAAKQSLAMGLAIASCLLIALIALIYWKEAWLA